MKLVGVLFEKEPNVPLLVVWTKQPKVLTSNDAVKRAVKKEMVHYQCLQTLAKAISTFLHWQKELAFTQKCYEFVLCHRPRYGSACRLLMT